MTSEAFAEYCRIARELADLYVSGELTKEVFQKHYRRALEIAPEGAHVEAIASMAKEPGWVEEVRALSKQSTTN